MQGRGTTLHVAEVCGAVTDFPRFFGLLGVVCSWYTIVHRRTCAGDFCRYIRHHFCIISLGWNKHVIRSAQIANGACGGIFGRRDTHSPTVSNLHV